MISKGHWPVTILLGASILISILFNILILVLLLILLLSFNLFFFRDPERYSDSSPKKILAPADGLLFEISQGISLPDDSEKYIVFKIRMSLFNIHVNRMPLEGELTSITIKKGGHLPMLPWGNLNTGSNAGKILKFKKDNSLSFYVVQISGLIAQRCVVYPKVGETLPRGMRFGIIKYSSEVDIYFPEKSITILVSEKTVCRAGITVIAELKGLDK